MRALVVGAGRMGGFHRRALMDLGLDVTTVDPDPAAGADYTSVPTLLARSMEVVCVATPIRDLPEQAARFAGRHRFLLIEKPMAPTVGAARELAALLAGEPVAVGYVERFNPRVRHLRKLLADAPTPTSARFTRWNDRPSHDIAIDVASHDVDLARFLGLVCVVEYDARADTPTRRREIAVHTGAARALQVDLMAHTTSPLHAQWHAFLSGRRGHATPDDAISVLTAIETTHLAVAA